MRAAHGQCPGFSDLNLYGHSMVPAAFSVAGTCVFIGSVCSGVPGWLFPVGCSRLVVPVRLLLFPPGCRLFPPGFGCSRPASVVPARFPVVPVWLFPFGCSCSALVVPAPASVALPRLQLSRPGSVAPARLRLFPSGCLSFLPPQFAEKKPNVCAVPYFFIYLRVSFRAGGNLPIFVRL